MSSLHSLCSYPCRFLSLLLLVSLAFGATPRDSERGLYFNEANYTLAEPKDSAIYHGMKTVLYVHPDDLSETKHHSNSNMARIALHVLSSGGGARPHRIDDFREQVFVILEGTVDFTVDGETLQARMHDVVFIPPGTQRSFSVNGAQTAKVIQAEWFQKGPRPDKAGRAFVTSDRIRLPIKLNGEGFMTVTPNARQQGFQLSIVSYGASHINASHSLLLYHLDLPSRGNFTANTMMARVGLSLYNAKGGTRWHYHPEVEQAFVFLSGKGLMEIGANTIEVKAGDMVFAPRHVGHGYMTTGEEPLKFLELEWVRH